MTSLPPLAMSPPPSSASPESRPVGRTLLMAVLAGLIMPLVCYLLLPLWGVHLFADQLGFGKIIALGGAVIFGVGYLYYIRFVLPRPQLIVAFILIAWPLVDYFNNQLLRQGIINLHMRPILFFLILVPAIWASFQYGRQLLQTIPWLKYYLLFFLWMTLYLVVFNANAMDTRVTTGESTLSEGSLCIMQYTSFLQCLICITMPAVAFLRVKNYRNLFDTLNKGLLIVTSLESLVTIGGYPFGLFNMQLDGFLRSYGIFTHPNPFAHHMGILMVYFLGLFCYYQGERKSRMGGLILLGGLAINFLAFLLGLSKGAIAAFTICAVVLFILNLGVPAVRQGFIKILIAMAVLFPIGIFAFSAISGQSFFELLQSRVEQTQSLTWRSQVWQDLLADITPTTMWLGHGFTSANATLFQLTYNADSNAEPLMMVHNGYINLIYDLGIMGWLMFLAAVSVIFNGIRGWFSALQPQWRTEYSIMIALSIYFLMICGGDEMTYMFDAPMLYWALCTILFCMQCRNSQSERARAEGLPDVSPL